MLCKCFADRYPWLGAAGETIPLSDSDEEVDSDTESLDGVHREADMFLLTQAVLQYGVKRKVVRAAASMMTANRGVCMHSCPPGPTLAVLFPGSAWTTYWLASISAVCLSSCNPGPWVPTCALEQTSLLALGTVAACWLS